MRKIEQLLEAVERCSWGDAPVLSLKKIIIILDRVVDEGICIKDSLAEVEQIATDALERMGVKHV